MTFGDTNTFDRKSSACCAEQLKTSRRQPALRVLAYVLTAMTTGAVPGVMFAAELSRCIGPPALEQATASQHSGPAYDSLGQYFAQHNQIECAISSFEKALQLGPPSWESQYSLGLALITNGQEFEAVSHLQEALRLDPDNANISMALGSAFVRLHDSERAIDQYRLVLKANPESVHALTAMSRELIAERRYNAAINLLQRSNDIEARRLLAEAYTKNDDPEKAGRTLQSIVSSNPDDIQAHIDLGEVLQRQGDYESASREFKQAMDLDPLNEYACISYLNTEVILQQYASAYPIAAELLRKKPHDFAVVYLNGLIERNLNDDAAEPHLQEAIKLNPESYEAHYTLGFVLGRRSKASQAVAQLQVALRLNPHSIEARFQLGKALHSLGKNDEAQQQFAILQQQKQDEARKLLAGDQANLAAQAFQAGDASKAIRLYTEAINEDPNNAYYYYSLALVLDRRGEIQRERQALHQSLERNANFAPAHNQVGYLDMQSGDLANAEVQFKASTGIDPQFAEATNNLGVLYGKLGRAAEAKNLFLRAVEDNPSYAQAYINLALVLASVSNYTDANIALENALKIAPHDPTALSVQKLVESQLKQ